MKNIPKEIIEATANAVMQGFIPKSDQELEFSFYFTIPPSANFKATYQKVKGSWQLISVHPDNL